MGELEPLVKKVFEQVKVELTEAKVELEACLSKELKSKFFADLSPKEQAALLEGLMDGVETCINMGKGRMDELIANPTESTGTLFEKLDIDKCVREYHSVRCSRALGAKDAFLRAL